LGDSLEGHRKEKSREKGRLMKKEGEILPKRKKERMRGEKDLEKKSEGEGATKVERGEAWVREEGERR